MVLRLLTKNSSQQLTNFLKLIFFFKFVTTLVDPLFIEPMLHLSHEKQIYSQTIHLTHELILYTKNH